MLKVKIVSDAVEGEDDVRGLVPVAMTNIK